MIEPIKIPESIHFCAEDYNPGETIVLLTGEPGAISVVGTVYNFDDFPCLEEEQAEECHKAARAIAEKITRSYNSHDDLAAACEQIIKGWGHQDGVSLAVKLARAALDKAKPKATGEPS